LKASVDVGILDFKFQKNYKKLHKKKGEVFEQAGCLTGGEKDF
jgi:hypothetical protein